MASIAKRSVGALVSPFPIGNFTKMRQHFVKLPIGKGILRGASAPWPFNLSSNLMLISGAFFSGLLASPHCLVMCGPLAATVLRPGNWRLHACYHVSRLWAFSLLGGLAGSLGSPVLKGQWRLFPWAMGFFFLGMALRVDRYIPKPAFVIPFLWRISARFQKKPKLLGALVLGLLTPFVPCGPLYLIVGLALLSGSFWDGFILLLGFGCGTLVLLSLAYWQWTHLQGRASPSWTSKLQRILAFIAASIIFCRLILGCRLGFGLCV